MPSTPPVPTAAPAPPAPAWSWVERHPLAARLDAMGPGLDLARTLLGVSLSEADEAALVEMIAAWERVVSWASAAQAAVVAEMVRRTSSGREAELVAPQIAARVATTGRAAEDLVDLAVRLDHSPAVHDALADGAVDVRKARVLVQETAHLGLGTARIVQEAVLGEAPGLTAPQIRSAIRRTELTLDPGAAEERHRRAKAERCVRMTPAPDSMAWLTAFLPADDAMRVMTGIDAIASTHDPDDPRGIDARRADALVDVLAGVLDSGVGPYGALNTRQRRRPHLEVTASAHSLLGLDATPATLAGYGPIPATMARQIADEATWRPVLVDAETGVMVARAVRSYRPAARLADDVMRRDVTCTFPGCRIPAARCDLDHVEPFDHDAPSGHDAASSDDAVSGLGPGSGHDASSGHGASSDERDRVPGTRHDNLHALCRFHHRLKTHGGWYVDREPGTGATLWTAPTGHRYRRDAIPAEPLRHSPAADPPAPLDPPDPPAPPASPELPPPF